MSTLGDTALYNSEKMAVVQEGRVPGPICRGRMGKGSSYANRPLPTELNPKYQHSMCFLKELQGSNCLDYLIQMPIHFPQR
jgi:hypothetical protein